MNELIIKWAIAIIFSYLLGSVSTSVIVSQVLIGDDIRGHGSGNAGSTNMLRTYGGKLAALVFAGDTLKAVAAVVLGRILLGEAGGWICGFFCVMGHIFPVFFGFKGGKGAATTAAMILSLDIRIFAVIFVLFFALFAWKRTVSISSITCAAVLPFLTWLFTGSLLYTVISVLSAVAVILCHIPNIKRIIKGTEPRTILKKEERSNNG